MDDGEDIKLLPLGYPAEPLLLFPRSSRQGRPPSPVLRRKPARFFVRRAIDMQRVNSLLRATSSRIRRRLAQIVEIAAASLPSVGA
jgi:hypothetical protein